LDTKNTKYFDIPSEVLGDRDYHPNIKSDIKNHAHIINYTLKDHAGKLDDSSRVMISDDLRIKLSPQGTLLSSDHILLKLVRDGKIDDAMAMQERLHPKSILDRHMQIEKSYRDLYLKKLGYKSKFVLDDFVIPPILTALLIKARVEQKTLFILGEPGSGKTKFMLAYCESEGLKPLIVNNVDALKSIHENHGMIVFDDVDFSKATREQVISLLDCEKASDLKIIYQTIYLRADLPRTVLSNRDPEKVFYGLMDLGEIKRRLLYFDLEGNSLKPTEAVAREEKFIRYTMDSPIPEINLSTVSNKLATVVTDPIIYL
jgi:hypothetical protein